MDVPKGRVAQNFNKAFSLRKEDAKPEWIVIDARGQIVGRLATRIADLLRGKNKPIFTPHADAGDYVVVINAQDVVFTGKKMEQKTYWRYSGYVGNRKTITVRQMMEKDPTHILRMAVTRMLPKNRLSRQLARKLRIYTGAQHPHVAQVSKKSE